MKKQILNLLIVCFIITPALSQEKRTPINNCESNTINPNDLVINGGFQMGNTGFTSEAPFNGECSSRSYSVEKTAYDKCGNFSKDFTGIDTCDLMLIVDSPGNDKALWISSSISVEAGKSYLFSFQTAGFTPRSNYTNTKPSIDATINGETILSVSADDVLFDEFKTFTATPWVAQKTEDITIKLIHKGGNDYVVDNISFIKPESCESEVIDVDNLVENGGFQMGNTGFTSEAPYNGECSSRSYSVEKSAFDKCGNFSKDFTGIDTCDLMLIVDSPGNDKALWISTPTSVEAGKSYLFSFQTAGFTPRSNYTNTKPSIDASINGETVLSVSADDVLFDEFKTFTATPWVAQKTEDITIKLIHKGGNDYVVDNISLKEDITLSLSNTFNKKEINIYPNPVENELNIESNNNNGSIVNIYTVNGTMVDSFKSVSNKLTVNTSDLTKGIYIIELVQNDSTHKERFIKK